MKEENHNYTVELVIKLNIWNVWSKYEAGEYAKKLVIDNVPEYIQYAKAISVVDLRE